MPTPPATPAGLAVLTPEQLAKAHADPTRKWAARALCLGADPELFFPPADGPGAAAQRICAMCAVRGECLAYAVTADEPFGIWGGLGPRERKSLRRHLQRDGELPYPGSESAA